MEWVIERDVYLDGNPEKMAKYLQAKGIKFKWVSWPEDKSSLLYKEEEKCSIVYGSISFMRWTFNQKPEWIPCAWYKDAEFCTTKYLSHWLDYSVQKDSGWTTWGGLKKQYEQWYRMFDSKEVFIRPDRNIKMFDGQIVPIDKFEDWYYKELINHRIYDDELILVSKPVEILREWRAIIVKRQMITCSKYMESGKSEVIQEEPTKVTDFVSDITKHHWQPSDAYVLDLCETKEGIKMVEIGSVNCAGLYGCNIEKFVDALTELAEEEKDSLL